MFSTVRGAQSETEGFLRVLRMARDYMSGVLKTRVSQDPMERKQVQRIIAINLNKIVTTADTCSGVISESDLLI